MIYSGDLDEAKREIVEEICEKEWSAEDRRTVEEVTLASESVYDWEYGVYLYGEDGLQDYARSFAYDHDGLSRDSWVVDYVDWERAAEALTQDMVEITYGGSNYYVNG